VAGRDSDTPRARVCPWAHRVRRRHLGRAPAKPSALGLAAISTHSSVDEAHRRSALAHAHALPPLRRTSIVALLAQAARAAERSPRTGALSLHLADRAELRSQRLVAVRYLALLSSRPLAEDRRMPTKGTEFVRGSDAPRRRRGLRGFRTINHNTLLIDDHGRHMNYPPNQGVWGDVRTSRFGDDRAVTVVAGTSRKRTRRSVRRRLRSALREEQRRTMVYVRPRCSSTTAFRRTSGFGVWAAHLTGHPRSSGVSDGPRRASGSTCRPEPRSAREEALREGRHPATGRIAPTIPGDRCGASR
jgi:hypothetical protein